MSFGLEHDEYDLTPAEADAYMDGSERQRVRKVMADIVGDGTVLDVGCGRGLDARRYRPEQYCGIEQSGALFAAAVRQNPGHSFVRWDVLRPEPGPGTPLHDFAIVKSVLEHVPSLDAALGILRFAMGHAFEVLLAWHTPPMAHIAVDQIRRVPGHFGRIVYQNRYRLAPFLAAIEPRSLTSETVDNFHLWRIR